jgi:hypothetical protein
MRVKHSEQKEFLSRFHCVQTSGPLQNVRVEIETASGDLAAVAYVSDADSSKATDWLRLFRIADEVNGLDHPPAASFALEVPQDGPLAWTFESHRRNCPRCGRRIMKVALLCGYCWIRMQPAIESEEERGTHEGPVLRDASPGATPGDRRACPRCGKMILLNALQCGYCWSRSPF